MEKAVDAAGCSGNEAIRRNLVHRILIPRVPLQNWVHSKRLMSCYTANSGLIHMAILIRSDTCKTAGHIPVPGMNKNA